MRELRYKLPRMRAPRGDGLVWRFVWPWLALLGLLVLLAACTGPYKLISARHIKCPPRKLEIRNLVSAPTREDWIAVCGEQTFACATRERGRRLIYTCRPLAQLGDAGVQVDAAAADGAVSAPAPPSDAGRTLVPDAENLTADAAVP
jgi:hypothetical protein